MAAIETLRDRPFLTGLLLGLVLFLSGSIAQAASGTVALLVFAAGTVGAIYARGWLRPAGQALAGAGATVLLLEIVSNNLAIFYF
jgi:hypothetical protein